MSQNFEYFNRRGVTKHGCGCTLLFHLYRCTVHLSTIHKTAMHNCLHQSCTYWSFICFAFLWIFTVYHLKLFWSVTVPLSDTVILSLARHIRLTSIDVSKWYWDVNSLYRKNTFPKSSAPVCSCIANTLQPAGKICKKTLCYQIDVSVYVYCCLWKYSD